MGFFSRVGTAFKRASSVFALSLADLDRAMDLTIDGGLDGSTVVTPDAALRHVVVYRCVSLIASAVACLPMKVYRKLDPRGKQEVRESTVYAVLHDQPNPLMTATEFRMAAGVHLCLRGNHYSQIIRNGRGEVVELWPLVTDNMEVWSSENGRELRYLYRTRQGTVRPFTQSEILHLRNIGGNGITGFSTIQMGASSISLGLTLDRFQLSFYKNQARPGVLLKTPKVMTDDAFDRFKKRWNEQQGGASNAGKLAILEEGLELAGTVAITQRDAQALETMKLSRGDAALLFGVPPHMVGDTEKSTSWGTGIEQQTLGFHTFTLNPYLRVWETRCNSSLFTASDQKRGLFCEHVLAGLLRGDIKARSEALDIWRRNGVINADEWRDLENLNPRDDGRGGAYWQPVNYIAAGEQAPAPPVRMLTKPVLDSLLTLYRAAYERVLRRARNDYALVTKGKRAREDWQNECSAYAREQIEPLHDALRALGGSPVEFDVEVLSAATNGKEVEVLAQEQAARSLGGA